MTDAPTQLNRFYTEQSRLLARKPRVHPSLEAAATHYRKSVGEAISEPSARLIVTRGCMAVTASATSAASSKSNTTTAAAAAADSKTLTAAAPAAKNNGSSGGFVFRHDPRIVSGLSSPLWTSRAEIGRWLCVQSAKPLLINNLTCLLVDQVLAAVVCPVLCLMVGNDMRRELLSQPPKPNDPNWILSIFGYFCLFDRLLPSRALVSSAR